MDRLIAAQELKGGGELESANGWFKLMVHPLGGIVVYRVQTRAPLWVPVSNPPPPPGSYLRMQTDGNFVAYAPNGTLLWASNSSSPGSYVVMQDDGNLVVYDSAGTARWASNTDQDLRSPTIRYADRGFWANEVSESWKELCLDLPCFAALKFPGYATIVIEDHIEQQDVVIQLWIGRCPKFLGLSSFPGGVGGEVGVYRRMPGRPRPTRESFSAALGTIAQRFLTGIAGLTDDQLWWPYPELGATLEFKLVNPLTNQVFFDAGPQTSYWLAKWVEESSYREYRQGSPTPNVEDYLIEYSVNGLPLRRRVPAAVLLLLS